MFVAAIASGATALGVDVHVAGVLPTPALAFLAGQPEFAAGIMVSASHNPADDNGLKVLDEYGLKLDDDVEDELEALIFRAEELPVSGMRRWVGSSLPAALLERYRRHRVALARTVRARRSGLILDCANGSGGVVGPGDSSPRREPTSRSSTNDPDGVNINVRCGGDGAGLARGDGGRPEARMSDSRWTATPID